MLVIYSGTSESDHVTEGDFLQPIGSVHLEDVVYQLTGELKKADVMIRNLVEISSKVNNGEGNLGRMLNDSSLVMKMDQSADNFVYLTQNLKILSEQLRNPDSDIGKLVYRDNLTTKMDSILSTMNRVAANTEMATRDLARTSEQLHSSALAINTGSGAVHKLLYDSAFADTIGLMIDNLNQTLIEVEKVAVNLQHKKLFGGTKEKK
jgi:phospholipid/cholesterol/gamma-HCH transport system substrate-binding protein